MLIRIKVFGFNRSRLFVYCQNPHVLASRQLASLRNSQDFKLLLGKATRWRELRRHGSGYPWWICRVHCCARLAGSAFRTRHPNLLELRWMYYHEDDLGRIIQGFRLQVKDRLLIPGGSTSVGLAAVVIAKCSGAFVTDA